MRIRLDRMAVFVGMLAVALPAGIVRSDLVALWDFDSGAANDSFGDNHGTPQNGAVFSTDSRFGTYSLRLNGVDGHILVNNAAALNFTSAITIAAWANADTWEGKNARIVQKGIRDDQYRLTSEWGYMSFDLKNVGRLDISMPPAGKWVHIAATYDGSRMCMYYDGRQVASRQAQGLIATTRDSLNIGTKKDIDAPPDDHFKGRLDDVIIFDHALSPQEIGFLYRHGAKSLISKRYKDKVIDEVEAKIQELEPQHAVDFLQDKINEYEQQKEKDLNDVELQSQLLVADLYFLLAKAKKAAGTPAQDIIAAHKRSISRLLWRTNYGPANFLWLFENIPNSDYADVVESFAQNTNILSYNIYHIVGEFESSGNWDAFKLFLDSVFSEVEKPAYYAVIVAKGLEKDGVWARKFSKYCQSNSDLTGYVFRTEESIAEEYLAQQDYRKATETYQDIIGQCGPNQRKDYYEFKLCECLFSDRQYENAKHTLESFVKNNKTMNRDLTGKAIMLKGQVHLHLGSVEQAIDTFLVLAIEYPETEQATEATFFIGYCYMLQGKFDEATEAFDLVVRGYPESSYSDKAKLCMDRIKSMGD